jgi:uncharacterized protein YndB with AHSA1/START domain
MTDRSVTHDTMVLERIYRAPAARVFAAWADPTAKQTWFTGAEPEEFTTSEYELDFRVGGREFNRGGPPGSADVFTYEATYSDIVDGKRIVYTNYMLRNETRISVSAASVEFVANGDETTLVFTEHGIYLDGEDKPEYRIEGINQQLDALGRFLDKS